MKKMIFASLVFAVSLAACGGGGAVPAGDVPTRPSSQNGSTPGSTSTLGTLSTCSAMMLPTSSGSTTTSCSVSETGYTGALTITDGGSCAGIIAFSPATFNGPTGDVTVAQLGAGSCTLTASDANGQEATISVSSTTSSTVVVVPGPLETCGSLSLPVDGSQSASCLISEASYTGTFNVDASACAGIVTVTPTSASGPYAYITATQVGGGSCTITVSDSKWNRGTVQIGSTWVNATVSFLETFYAKAPLA